MTQTSAAASGNTLPEPTLFGHPKGLFVLFSTELWERFSFYSMRGVMTLYMVNIVLAVMTAAQGKDASGGFADEVYGAYLGFVYSATFVGGMLADRLLGQRRAIYIGGVLMSLAHFTLTTHSLIVTTSATYKPGDLNLLFYGGLGLLCCGNGFFKPNISTIVGTLYGKDDSRRDGAFTIFYMGINIGATLSSFSSGIAQKWGWYLAYLLAGIGMIASLITLFAGQGLLQGRGMPPVGAKLTGKGRFGVPNVAPLLLGVVVFIPVVGYLLAHPSNVQSLAQWLAVGVLFYLLWEAARAEQPREAHGPVHATAIGGGLFGLLALASQMLAAKGAESANGGWLAGSASLLHGAAILFFVASCAALLYLIVRAARTQEGGRMFVVVLLCAFSMVFWGFFELQGSTIIRFADEHVSLQLFGWDIPAAFFGNFVNPFLIILFGIPFAWLWVWMGRRNVEPSTPLKFSLGLFQVGLAFVALWCGAKSAGEGKGGLGWLMLAYLLLTTGELCLSPVGLSMVTKLAPARLVGVFMGLWFLAPAIGNVITGGTVGPMTKEHGFAYVFIAIAAVTGASAVLLALLSPILKKLMYGVK